MFLNYSTPTETGWRTGKSTNVSKRYLSLNRNAVPAGGQDADSSITASRSMERRTVKIENHLIRVDSNGRASDASIGEVINQKISARSRNEKRYRAY